MNLKVTEKFTVTGRGDVLVVDLKENGLTTENWVENIPIKVGHSLMYENEDYIITGVETKRDTLRGYLNTNLGLLIRKIKNE